MKRVLKQLVKSWWLLLTKNLKKIKDDGERVNKREKKEKID